MTHTLTFHSIQNVQLRPHHVGRGISPYTPTPTRAHAYTPKHTDAYAPAPAQAHAYAPATSGFMCHLQMVNALTCFAFVCMMCHTPASTPASLCSELQPSQPLMLS
ncbi:hypothetical protein O181_114314 [Austropuccinia psidii MF-1]|uniref:Uncharacterized protein n=1 Tax=Austropuccinia psidii MF-1 TaxID=1389203 RepID=A0A9Q3K7K4_9BASI|nr:hypothetical protein [Austropuccinia psidii MF-1]